MDVLSEEEINRYTGHTNSKFLIDSFFYKDGETGKNILISGSEDGNIYSWDILNEKNYCKFYPFESPLLNNEVNTNTNTNSSSICLSINSKGLLVTSGFPDNDSLIFNKIKFSF